MDRPYSRLSRGVVSWMLSAIIVVTLPIIFYASGMVLFALTANQAILFAACLTGALAFGFVYVRLNALKQVTETSVGTTQNVLSETVDQIEANSLISGPLVNSLVSSLMNLRKLFTGSIDQQEQADKALLQACKDFTDAARRHGSEFDTINQLRMQQIAEQELLNAKARESLAELRKENPAVTTSTTVVYDSKAKRSSMSSIQSSRLDAVLKRLEELNNEYDQIELPQIQFKKLSLGRALALRMEVEKAKLEREEIFNQIKVLSLECFELIKSQNTEMEQCLRTLHIHG